MLKELNGTEFKYTLRDEVYNIKLSENKYQISTQNFTLDNTKSFRGKHEWQQPALLSQ